MRRATLIRQDLDPGVWTCRRLGSVRSLPRPWVPRFFTYSTNVFRTRTEFFRYEYQIHTPIHADKAVRNSEPISSLVHKSGNCCHMAHAATASSVVSALSSTLTRNHERGNVVFLLKKRTA